MIHTLFYNMAGEQLSFVVNFEKTSSHGFLFFLKSLLNRL